jgi:hypothetical protein
LAKEAGFKKDAYHRLLKRVFTIAEIVPKRSKGGVPKVCETEGKATTKSEISDIAGFQDGLYFFRQLKGHVQAMKTTKRSKTAFPEIYELEESGEEE